MDMAPAGSTTNVIVEASLSECDAVDIQSFHQGRIQCLQRENRECRAMATENVALALVYCASARAGIPVRLESLFS